MPNMKQPICRSLLACAEGDSPLRTNNMGDGASDEHRLATVLQNPASQPTRGQPTTQPSGTRELVDDRIVVAEHPIALKEKPRPKSCSPMVVATKSSPATTPHRYDCGLRNTIA